MEDISPLAVEIREMRLDDLDHVYCIETSAYSNPWPFQSFVDELTRNHWSRYIVAESEGQIRGYAGMWLIAGEAHITNIAVDFSFRRRMVGEQLLLRLIEIALAEECFSMFLEVRRYNLPAQRLYSRYRFKPIRVREKYYQDNLEDAIELRVEDTASSDFADACRARRAALTAALGKEDFYDGDSSF